MGVRRILHHSRDFIYPPIGLNLITQIQLRPHTSPAATMPFIPPSVLRTLIASALPSGQLDAAYSRFSSSKSPTGTNQLSIWFGQNVTPTMKQVILSSDDTAGVLIYSKGFFTVIS
jgi:hypothetical protein